MLEIWKDGKKIECESLCDKAKEGQVVIFGTRVDWGENPDPIKNPLSRYPYLSIFTVVEKVEGEEGYYILRDVNDNFIKIQLHRNTLYLYDAQEWVNWNAMHENEKLSRKQRKIEQLEGHIQLLKDILIKQGIRTVTQRQAKELNILDKELNILDT